eukprot:TRINITY_DN117312_c0_g1_i1.p1 TRINITY_DN117312_c0_g1~~TRINITY_DN117312_c0_g1_i1.p1  ORF type:complete len:174 (+),score=24.99 TRINITY_DN117312_c0_g1_i1:26-547(+)
MKKIILVCLVAVCGFTAFGQKEGKKKEIRKEIRMEEENGEKVLHVSTTENGKTTEEVYKGAEAEAKLKEIEAEAKVLEKEAAADPNKKVVLEREEVKESGDKKKSKKNSEEVRQEVKVGEKDGVKTVKVRTTKNGMVKEEVYEGEAAEKKLQEMESKSEQGSGQREKEVRKKK